MLEKYDFTSGNDLKSLGALLCTGSIPVPGINDFTHFYQSCPTAYFL